MLALDAVFYGALQLQVGGQRIGPLEPDLNLHARLRPRLIDSLMNGLERMLAPPTRREKERRQQNPHVCGLTLDRNAGFWRAFVSCSKA